MHQYKDLQVWLKAIYLVTRVYQVTKCFPSEERYGLVSQINRSAVSIPSNIAEGAGRNSDKEFLNFLAISHASSYELETQLLISYNLGYLEKSLLDELNNELSEIQRMNFALQKRLKTQQLTT